jgi:predicted transcriptional regulator
MPSQTITLELPDDLYQTAHKLAIATKRPLAAVLQESKVSLSKSQQETLQALLYHQSEGELTADEAVQLQDLMDAYGRLLVRQSHVWLLLARRGYVVPPQKSQE